MAYDRRRFLQFSGAATAGFGLSQLPILAQTALGQTSGSKKSVPRTVKVGILHSLSGTMAISERSVVDATRLAIEEINQAGGVLGRSIDAILADGQSDWPTFADQAKELVKEEGVVTVFGCWTSASRLSTLPIWETNNHLLWYPVNYEGQECSENILYTGWIPNQMIEPLLTWMPRQFAGKPVFLLGSDYNFPRVINSILKNRLEQLRIPWIGEDYIPLGQTNVRFTLERMVRAAPKGCVILNSLSGDTNVSFFKEMRSLDRSAQKYPIISTSILEEEVKAIRLRYLQSHFSISSYFQTLDNPANKAFIQAFRKRYGDRRLLNAPMASAYSAVYLWKAAVEKAQSFIPAKVRQAARGLVFDSPMGKVRMNVNHHLSLPCLIGRVRADGLFDIVYHSKAAIAPQPWHPAIEDKKGDACDWSDPKRGEKYRV